jgi:Zn-dependent protease with chaperone function
LVAQKPERLAVDLKLPPAGERLTSQGVKAFDRSGLARSTDAFALPSGTLVVTDELAALVTDELAALVTDDEVVAVLGHELGHVERRHVPRQFSQSSVVGLVTGWLFGDISGVLAGLPAALLDANYSRAFEAEADHYAAAMLLDNGTSPALLATALEKIAADAGSGRRPRSRKTTSPATPPSPNGPPACAPSRAKVPTGARAEPGVKGPPSSARRNSGQSRSGQN